MDVVTSGDPPLMSVLEVQLSVRHGREAVAFYEAVFGAWTLFRLGGTDGSPELVAQLQVGSTRFWVEDESPTHGNFSPQSLNGATARLLLVVDDPAAAVERALAAGARRGSRRWPSSTVGCWAAWWTPSATTGRSDGRSGRGPRQIVTERNDVEEQPLRAAGDGRTRTGLPRCSASRSPS